MVLYVLNRTTFLRLQIKNFAKRQGKTMKDVTKALGIHRGSIYWLLKQDFSDWKDEYKERLKKILQIEELNDLLEGYEENDSEDE